MTKVWSKCKKDELIKMKRLLISKQDSDRVAMGISEAGIFTELDTSDSQLLNIYYGVIKSVELDCVMVDFGASQLGTLPLENVSQNYFNGIEHKLEIGQNVIVQLLSESEHSLLSTYISLTGSSLKLLPKNLNPINGNSIKSLNFSSFKESGIEYQINSDFGFVILNGQENKDAEELEWDLNVLLHHWQAIKEVTLTREPTFLIHKEHNPIISPIKNAISSGVTEIFVDDSAFFKQIKTHLELANSEVEVFYYDLPDKLINRYRERDWEIIKERKIASSKNSLWNKVVNLFSKHAAS